MMKAVVLIACGLFGVALGNYPDHPGYGYHGPKHYPIITKAGVPLDTPAVRHAKVQHHIAKEVAAHRAGEGHLYNDYHEGHGYGYAAAYDHYAPYHGYHGPKHYPIITKAGVPLEPPAVRHARIQHYIAKEVAAHRSYDHGYYGPEDEEPYYHGGYGGRYGYGHELHHPLPRPLYRHYAYDDY